MSQVRKTKHWDEEIPDFPGQKSQIHPVGPRPVV